MDLHGWDPDVLRAAIGALLRSNVDPGQRTKDLARLTDALAEKEIEPAPSGEAIRHVTLITSADAVDPHLSVVVGYVLCLLASTRIERISVVFTAEFSGVQPRDSYCARNRLDFERALARHRELCSGQVTVADLDRVEILVWPSLIEFAKSIGDAVIRFEGAIPRFTTFLGGRSLYRQRPVITATYSSLVQRGRHTDITLVRGAAEQQGQASFIPALVVPGSTVESSHVGHAGQDLLTVYGQNRLAIAMAALRIPDWNDLIRYFQRHPEAKWHLIGAEDPGVVIPRIPVFARQHLEQRIIVRGRTDLTSFFSRSAAFLPLQGILGGALGALQAIRAGCPVVSRIDRGSDISNFIPESLQFPTLEAVLLKISGFAADPASRASMVAKQQELLINLSDFAGKGRELWNAIEAARQIHVARVSLPSGPELAP